MLPVPDGAPLMPFAQENANASDDGALAFRHGSVAAVL